jgi:hypothetical protein
MPSKMTKEVLSRIMEEAYSLDPAKLPAFLDKYWSPGIIYHSIQMGDIGFEQAKQFQIGVGVGLKPQMTLHHIILDDNMAAVQLTLTGTHQNTFMDIPATGKKVKIEIAQIMKFDGDKITELWMYYDNLSALKQIGVMPGPTAPQPPDASSR